MLKSSSCHAVCSLQLSQLQHKDCIGLRPRVVHAMQHPSSQPVPQQLLMVAATADRAGAISGQLGVCHLHLDRLARRKAATAQ